MEDKTNPESIIQPKWDGVQKDIIIEIIRQAELQLAAQQAFGIASDQRASSMLSMTVTTATAALGGGLAMLSAQQPNYALGFGGVFSGWCLMLAAWYLLEALRPVDFYYVGNWPRSWFNEKDISRKVELSLGEMTVSYDGMLEFNDRVIKGNGKLVKYATRAIFAAPLVGFFAAMVAWMVSTS